MKDLNNAKFISVYQPYDTIQAGLIQSTLEKNDIVCYVNNENGSSVRFGGLGFGAASMMVMVPESQKDQALQIISELGLE
jgi:hypothetical protein